MHESGEAPFGYDIVESPVFCCFFRDEDARSGLLAMLRTEAGGAPVAETDREDQTLAMIADYERHWQKQHYEDAIRAAIRWRTLVLQRGYHTYTLREGYPPFRYGAIITFEAVKGDELRAHLARAEEVLDDERKRTMDFFGWGVME
jgi:hypothetical protein